MPLAPIVSVVIPTYRRPEALKAAIVSVKQQTYLDYEIIVVDDNGDGCEMQKSTAAIVGLFAGNTNIKYIVHQFNLGGCAARNTGINSSNAEFIAFLDDDDRWDDSFLKTMLKATEEVDCGVYYCKTRLDISGNIITTNDEIYSGFVKEKLICGWCPRSTSQFLIKRSLLLSVDGFDPGLPSFQDYDLWYRLSSISDFCGINQFCITKVEHGPNQASVDPIRRKAGLDFLIKKMRYKLSDNEACCFDGFCRHQLSLIRLNEFKIAFGCVSRRSLCVFINAMLNCDLSNRHKLRVVLLFMSRIFQSNNRAYYEI